MGSASGTYVKKGNARRVFCGKYEGNTKQENGDNIKVDVKEIGYRGRALDFSAQDRT